MGISSGSEQLEAQLETVCEDAIEEKLSGTLEKVNA